MSAGLVIDDYWLASHLVDADGIRWPGLLDAFSLAAPGEAVAARTRGALPWWTDSEFAIQFLRPLAALTHALDFRFLRSLPWSMHAESVFVLGALNLAVGAWYRHLLPSRTALLALAFYALSPGHTFAASWLANRNACLATLFAVLALHWHHRARSERSSTHAALSCAALLLSLASGELGFCTLALLIAHALCLDQDAPRARLRALVPALLITLLWLALHRALGYGVRASSLYVDALHDPLKYLSALTVHVPILLFGQWVLPVSGFAALMSSQAFHAFALLGAVCMALLARPLWRTVRDDPKARFAACAALLALPPVAATVPHDRLLILSDLGACALFAALLMRPERSPALTSLAAVRALVGVLLSLGNAASLHQYASQQQPLRDVAAANADQTLVFVNAPVTYFPLLLAPLRSYEQAPSPERVLALAPGIYPLELERLDACKLALRSPHGLLQPRGQLELGEATPPPLSPAYLAQALSQFMRAERRFERGERIAVQGMQVEIAQVTAGGLPREVHFTLAHSLDDARFVVWRDRRYQPLALPAVGRRVQLAAIGSLD